METALSLGHRQSSLTVPFNKFYLYLMYPKIDVKAKSINLCRCRRLRNTSVLFFHVGFLFWSQLSLEALDIVLGACQERPEQWVGTSPYCVTPQW